MFRPSSSIILFLGTCTSVFAAEGPIAVTYRFEIVDRLEIVDGPPIVGCRELDCTAEAVAAACAAFGADCTEQAAVGAEVIKTINTAHSVTGEEHRGIIRAPVNYEICKAIIDWGHASIDEESTFNTKIVREPPNNGLGFFAVVPKNRPERHSIKATLYLEFVPVGSTNQYGCWPTNVNPWLAKGPNNPTFYPGAHL